MIVVIGGVKGGSGKSTIATNLTVMRALQGYSVLLVDADEQRSSSTWTEQRESNGFLTPWSTIQLGGENVGSQLQKIKKDYDDVIVDVGGRNTRSQRSAMVVSDIYLVPFQPRSLEIWTLGQVKSLINSAREINPNIKSYALLNRADAIGSDNRDAMEIISDCHELTCIPVIIGQRKAFANAATDGLGVVELKTSDKKASQEIMMLYEYIYK